MTHDEALSLLSARIDGPLTSDQQRSLDSWLAESPDNQVMAEAFSTQHGDLRTAFEPRREAAKGTAAAVARQLTNAPSPAPERPGPLWWRLLVTPLPAACAAALLIGLGLFVFNRGKQPDPKNTTAVATNTFDESALLGSLKPRTKPEAPKTVAVAVGDKIETKAGEKRRVVLPDGSLLYVDQSTRLQLLGDRRINLGSGNIFIEAIRAQSEAQQFLVETSQKSVKALGTKFAVSANDTGTGVLVTQGKVEVSGVEQKITSGQELPLGSEKISPAPRASAALEWTKDLMIAAESPLVPAGKHSGGSLVAVDPYGQEAKLSLVKFHVDVHIADGFARTTIDQTYFNAENQRMEGTFYFPLPPDGSLSRLAMYVDGDLMEGGMADRGHARDVYERIRYQNRDPALLEWVDGSVFKMRVFPLEARQEKRIVLSYTQRLPVLYGQSTYRFPSGHTLALVDKWSFNAVVKNGANQSAMSPSHPTMKIVPNGSDLVMTDEAKNAKVDRDVVLTLQDHAAEAEAQRGSVRWSSAEFEGQKYLLLRYRPDLPSAPRRERRDWVFLFESSGARDPLVARAQVEIIRSLLTHAEHEDTFSILSVGTRVRNFNATPQAATTENVADAIKWLENRHLIGALNLDQALSDAIPLLQVGSNPHLVHVGGGIASIGEQRADVLVKRIPQGTKYVGIGVGKRFSPAFMKVAAERTGGLFAQVNPDEPIAWRGFEIASTLNAPRLLNVRVEAPLAEGNRFLTFSNVLAHGEEMAAVVRVVGATPQAATVHGTLDGQAFTKTIPVENVAEGAGYLPRTWAKLEIDRLLAQDSAGNEKVITELSKAMYVMTPYTSLLVLENEQMYKDFKVDRGRKDHWAMYPCPAKIPVVYIPDPNQPAGSRPDLKGQKPHENAVLQTIMTRNPPRFLTWPGHDGGDNPIMTAGQKFGARYFMMPTEEDEEVLTNEDFGMDGSLAVDGRLSTARFRSENLGKALFDSTPWGTAAGERVTELSSEFREVAYVTNGALRKARVPVTTTRLVVTGGSRGTSSRGDPSRPVRVWDAESARTFNGRELDAFIKLGGLKDGISNEMRMGRRERDSGGMGLEFVEFNGDMVMFDAPFREADEKKLAELTGISDRLSDFRRIPDGWSRELENLSGNTREKLRLMMAGDEVRAMFEDKNEANDTLIRGDGEVRQRVLDRQMAGYMAQASRAPQYYGRPSYNGNHRVFTDLVSYCPGMCSSPADIRAVLEAEAAPRFGNKRGSIDPEARKLIDAARTADWKVLRFGKNKALAFHYDGQGRYAYERRLAFGLQEKVICDGTHLWHLYPELGIGAKRVVSRFHRIPLANLIPDFVPPADDLAYGADVKKIDERTVAIVPILPAKQEAPTAWIELHMVFEGSRLVERRWVLQGDESRKVAGRGVLAREEYSSDATRLIAGQNNKGEEKLLEKAERTVTAGMAPDLTPDTGKLVVLPLPLRSREHVYPQLNMEPGWSLNEDKNACFEYLAKDDAMKLLACEFASGNGGNMARVWDDCFGKDGDYRTGFFTLMAAANYNPRTYWQFNQAKFEKDPSDPLVRYLWQMHDDNIHDWQARYGFAPGRTNPETFLGKLTTFRRIVARWQGGYIHHGLWGQRDTERSRVIEFAKKNADNVLGWCTLSMVQDRCPNAAAWKEVAGGWTVLAEKSSLRYPALYEEARCLGNAKESEVAQKKFQDLFEAALAEGVLPPLDSSFRNVLESGKEDAWAKLMRKTAAKCAEKKARPVIITLAWQCNQLGDTAMSDTLLELALKETPAEEKAYTGIAAIHFLNATGRYDRADAIVRDLLTDEALANSAGLWRLASQTADNRRDPVRSIECLEKALDLEYARLPEVFDVQPIRNDYGRLLGHYEWLADASTSLKVAPPKDLPARVVKAVDRWRHLDPEARDVPNRAATILRKAGGDGATELAWDYATTPLALKPNESDPWMSLAWSVRQEGNWRLADKCYEMAYAAEPTNAQLLWDRAEHLRQQGQIADSRRLLKQLADSEWQPRFNGLKAQARQAVEGR
jgi:Ca-activated chloride channel family protein